jgi:uncharacterized protein
MKSKEITIEQERRYILIMDKHDEVIAELQKFADSLRTESGIPACSFTAIGGFERATLAYFDRNRMVYDPIPVGEQVEVLPVTIERVIDEETRLPLIRPS